MRHSWLVLLVPLLLVVVLVPGRCFAQTINYSVDAAPVVLVPLGSSREFFTTGFGGEARFAWAPPAIARLAPGATLDVSASLLSLPIVTADAVSILSAGVGPTYRLALGERLSFLAGATVGYYTWSPSGWESSFEDRGGLSFAAQLGTLVRAFGPVTLGADVSFEYRADLANGLGAAIHARLDLPGLDTRTSPIELDSIRFSSLYPVLYYSYDTHSVGTAVVRNTGRKAIEGISLSLYVDRYMDEPTTVSTPFTLAPGEERTVELFGLFTEDLLEITEGTRVSARVTVTHPAGRGEYEHNQTAGLEFHNRNALSWDDDQRIASFITSKDPAILTFSRNVVSWTDAVANQALDRNFQKGAAVFEAVRAHGVRYAIDPVTPFNELSGQADAIDFLQFPRQTLQYSSGDCDDLTALYCALLESAGVETAFITVPGHIYAAFALGLPAQEALRTFGRSRDLIVLDDQAWVPVEITLSQSSFGEAWAVGARQWRDHVASDQAVLHPTRDAWATYPAVGFREGSSEAALPDPERVVEAFSLFVNSYVREQLDPQIARLRERVETSRNPVPHLNRIAVLYAQYGLYDEAMEALRDALSRGEYAPSLTNMGNILLIREEYEAAARWYDRALRVEPDSGAALVGLARCNRALENYGTARRLHEQLAEVDPALAERFAHLVGPVEDSGRASDAASGVVDIIWEEAE